MDLKQGEIHALKSAAERAWSDDTRHENHRGHSKKSMGQCYVTSRWLQSRLGGNVQQKAGHFFWSDGQRGLDITGDHFDSHAPPLYKALDHHVFAGAEEVTPHPQAEERVNRFIQRADREFENLGDKISKLALDYAGDSHPMEQPQAKEDYNQRYPHDNSYFDKDEFKFVYANGQLEVSPIHDHKELMGHAGIDGGYAGPMATGYITLDGLSAVWEVNSNVGAKALSKVFNDYCSQVGWTWGGMTDLEGEPIGTGSEFAPKKKRSFVYLGDHLFVSSDFARPKDLWEKALHLSKNDPQKYFAGDLIMEQRSAKLSTFRTGPNIFWSTKQATRQGQNMLDALNEWATDNGFTLVGGNDNILKTIEDLDADNLYSPNPQQEEQPFFPPPSDPHERQQGGVYKCDHCERLFPNWHEFRKHQVDEEPPGDMLKEEPIQDGKFPVNDMDATFPTHHTERQPNVNVPIMGTTLGEARRLGNISEGDAYYVSYTNRWPVGAISVRKSGSGVVIEGAKGDTGAIIEKLKNIFPEIQSSSNQPGLLRIGQVYKWAEGKDPKDLLTDAVPFIYDVQEDSVTVGEAGTRTSDIQGKFTPGGIVEGTFEPGGKVMIRSMTNMPYTVRHMVELWYYQHPELEVKSVHLQDDAGNDTKLARRPMPAPLFNEVTATPAEDLYGPINGRVKGIQLRRPFRYDKRNHVVHLGPAGAYHHELNVPGAGLSVPMQNGYIMDDTKTVDHHGGVPDEVLQSVAEYAGPEYSPAKKIEDQPWAF